MGGADNAADTELDLRIETEVPTSLPPGAATSLFVFGSCFHRRLRIRGLEVLVDGVPNRASAHGMPRLDVHRMFHPEQGAPAVAARRLAASDPKERSFRSGFWASVPIRMPNAGEVTLAIRAALSDRSNVVTQIGRIAAGSPTATVSAPGDDAKVAIAMATFDPDIKLFEAQIETIRAQTLEDWICVISDDCTPEAGFAAIRSIVEGDPRFLVSQSPRRLGFYRNFERALNMVPPEPQFIALADHDDRWYPEKLATLVGSLGDAMLVYSDQRVVDADGSVVAEGYWGGKRSNNHTNLASLVIANTITGAASLFRREVLDLALPFPGVPGTQYHDHWLGLVAMASGGVSYVDRPLYDYVQHPQAALGYSAANVGPLSREDRPTASRLRPGAWARMLSGWRAAYFFAVFRSRVLAEVLLLRGGGLIGRRSRRVLGRFTRERSPLFLSWLALRRARCWVGKSETLSAERVFVHGILWRYAIRALVVGRGRPGRMPYDATLPEIDAGPDRGLREASTLPPG
jgi:glycosyltransferase involved in cell wall biosynthesis